MLSIVPLSELNKTVVYICVCCVVAISAATEMEGENTFFPISYGLDQSSFVSVKTGSHLI